MNGTALLVIQFNSFHQEKLVVFGDDGEHGKSQDEWDVKEEKIDGDVKFLIPTQSCSLIFPLLTSTYRDFNISHSGTHFEMLFAFYS